MKRWWWALTVLSLSLTLPACAQQATPPPAQPSRSLTVLAGAGQDTTNVEAFFPENMKIRAGDTVTWKINSSPNHTITFLTGYTPKAARPLPGGGPGEFSPATNIPLPGGAPGEEMRNPEQVWPTRTEGAPIETYDGTGYVHSGLIRNQPQAPGLPIIDSFALTFPKPGVYRYICAIHAAVMKGTVEVVENAVTEVPSQPEVDARAKAEMDFLLAKVKVANEEGLARAHREPGPNGTTTWYVRAGNIDRETGDRRALSYEFLPRDFTVQSGDTVVWGASAGHTVSFVPAPPFPEQITARAQPDGRPWLVRNRQIDQPAKPSAVFEPAKFYSSGNIGPTSTLGGSWILIFDQPGTYKYFCLIHRDLGMEGTVIVQPRS